MSLLTPWARWRRSAPAPPVYFVTWHLAPGQPRMSPRERDVVRAVLLRDHGGRYRLHAFVVMDDHVHVLVRPVGFEIGRVVQSWQYSSAYPFERLFRRGGPVWTGPCQVRVNSEGELREASARIVGNPWKRWPFVNGYRWVWEAGEGAGEVPNDE